MVSEWSADGPIYPDLTYRGVRPLKRSLGKIRVQVDDKCLGFEQLLKSLNSCSVDVRFVVDNTPRIWAWVWSKQTHNVTYIVILIRRYKCICA